MVIIMDLKQISYFIAVTEHKNFSKAAESLFVSQPSLSISIKKLEEKIGFELFYRDKRELELTEQGKMFYKRASSLFNHYNELQKDVEEISKHGSGTFVIGAVESSTKYLAKILEHFIKVYPDTNISIVEKNSSNINSDILENTIHIGLTASKINHEHIECIEITRRTFSVVFHKNHRFKDLNEINITDLSGETLIHSLPGSHLYNQFASEMLKKDVNLKRIVHVERFATAIELIGNEVGVSLIPTTYLEFVNSDKIDYIELNQEQYTSHIYKVRYKGRYLPESIYDFYCNLENYFNLE